MVAQGITKITLDRAASEVRVLHQPGAVKAPRLAKGFNIFLAHEIGPCSQEQFGGVAGEKHQSKGDNAHAEDHDKGL